MCLLQCLPTLYQEYVVLHDAKQKLFRFRTSRLISKGGTFLLPRPHFSGFRAPPEQVRFLVTDCGRPTQERPQQFPDPNHFLAGGGGHGHWRRHQFLRCDMGNFANGLSTIPGHRQHVSERYCSSSGTPVALLPILGWCHNDPITKRSQHKAVELLLCAYRSDPCEKKE